MTVCGPSELRLQLSFGELNMSGDFAPSEPSAPGTLTMDDDWEIGNCRDKLKTGEIYLRDILNDKVRELLSQECVKEAVAEKNIEKLEYLIEQDVNFNAKLEEGFVWQLCLNWVEEDLAADKISIKKLLEMLASRGIQFNASESNNKHDYVLFFLVKKILSKDHFTQLQKFIFEILILQHNVDANFVDHEGQTLLHYICLSAQKKSKIFLDLLSCLAKYVDINKENYAKKLFLHCFMHTYPQNEGLEFLKLIDPSVLKSQINNADAYYNRPLAYSTSNIGSNPEKINKRFREIEYLIALGADLNEDTHEGESLIHSFIRYGQFDYLLGYLRQFNDLTCRTIKSKSTPLIALIKGLDDLNDRRTLDCIYLIITIMTEQGLSFDAQDAAGYSPLHWAILLNRVDVARALIESGANRYILAKEHTSLLDVAAFGTLETFKYCLSLFLDDKKFLKSSNILFSLVKVQALDQMQLFLEAGGDVHLKDSNGFTAFNYAQKKMDVSSARKFFGESDASMFASEFLSGNPIMELTQPNFTGEGDLKTWTYTLNLAFLNSRLEDVQFLLFGFLEILSKNNSDQLHKILSDTCRICGGFFTWGSLIARFSSEEKQMSIMKFYGSKTKIEMNSAFVDQQTEMGYHAFGAVLKAITEIENGKNDFFHIYNSLAVDISNLYKKRQHSAARSFQQWRYSPQGNKDLFDCMTTSTNIETGIGYALNTSKGRYPTFIPKIVSTYNQVKTRDVEGVLVQDLYKNGYRITVKLGSKVLPLTSACFKKYYNESDRAHIRAPQKGSTITPVKPRNYVWNHMNASYLEEMMRFIADCHLKLINNFDENLFRSTAFKLFHAAPLMRGSAQAGHCWVVLLQLLNQQCCYPVTTSLGQLDCEIISIGQQSMVKNFHTYFDSSVPLILPDFRHLATYDEKIEAIELGLGRQFLKIKSN